MNTFLLLSVRINMIYSRDKVSCCRNHDKLPLFAVKPALLTSSSRCSREREFHSTLSLRGHVISAIISRSERFMVYFRKSYLAAGCLQRHGKSKCACLLLFTLCFFPEGSISVRKHALFCKTFLYYMYVCRLDITSGS